MDFMKFILGYFGLAPFCLGIGSFFLLATYLGDTPMGLIGASLLITVVVAAVLGRFAAKRTVEEQRTHKHVLAIFPLLYVLSIWAVTMILSEGFYGASIWTFYIFSQPAFLPIFLYASLAGKFWIYLSAPLVYNLGFWLGFILTERKLQAQEKVNPILKKIAATVVILSVVAGSFVQMQRGQNLVQGHGFGYSGGYASIDMADYEVKNANNILPKLQAPAQFGISDPAQMPVLDGAEAAFPIYSAFAEACYGKIGELETQAYDDHYKAATKEGNEVLSNNGLKVTFTNTIIAFERLLAGSADIFFGAEPSAAQRATAEQAGWVLVQTPIAQEAFIFFVNADNPVDHLSSEQLRQIYAGKITNWQQVGGENEKIMAFQRPENSGSQTMMQVFMGDTALKKPLQEELISGMGGIVQQVADYQNTAGAIGYSFRYYATGMIKNTSIKLLQIDGVAPSTENIKAGSYPLTTNFYAITLQSNTLPTVEPFLRWMVGAQGQELVEKIGYVSLK